MAKELKWKKVKVKSEIRVQTFINSVSAEEWSLMIWKKEYKNSGQKSLQH